MPNPLINIGSAANAGDGEVGPRAWLQKINRLAGPTIGNWVNVNSGDYSGTTEQKVTAAIADAKAQGKQYCFVTEPYNASLVTFDTAVHMMFEASDWRADVFDIMAYGAYGDNVKDDSAAIQAAINGACAFWGINAASGSTTRGEGATIYSPKGQYLIKTGLSITAQIVLQGTPHQGSVWHFNLTVPGICINWNPVAPQSSRMGMGARDMTFTGQTVTDGQTLFWLQNMPGFHCINCNFGSLGSGTIGIQNFIADTAGNHLFNVYLFKFDHCSWIACGTTWSNAFSAASNAQLEFQHCAFTTGDATSAANGFNVSSDCDIHFWDCSWDGCRGNWSAGTITFVGCHWEDSNLLLTATSLNFVSGVNTLVTSVGDWLLKPNSVGGSFWNVSAGQLSILGRWKFVATGGTPAAITISGSALVFVELGSAAQLGTCFTLFQGTSTGFCGLLPAPEVASADRGDASISLTQFVDFPVQVFNTPLTAPRTFTLPNNGMALGCYGLTYTVVRTAAATGASALTAINGTPNKALALGTWAKYAMRQDGVWIYIVGGTL